MLRMKTCRIEIIGIDIDRVRVLSVTCLVYATVPVGLRGFVWKMMGTDCVNSKSYKVG
jgi:hypothetical protein